MLPFLVLLVTLVVAAAGWWYLQQQKATKLRDEQAAALFKPKHVVKMDVLKRLENRDDELLDEDDDETRDDVARANADDDADRVDGGGAAAAAALTRLQKRKREKQQEKEQRLAEQAAMVEMQRKQREDRDRKDTDDLEAERMKQKEEEEALALLRLDKKRQDDEEYAKWTGHIGLESKGELGAADELERSLKSYLVSASSQAATKVLVLEDVAKQFQFSVDKLVRVIEAMVQDSSLSGVFDDRGKFIFVSDDEYQQIARFLRNRGRVSLTELIRESNRIVTAAEA